MAPAFGPDLRHELDPSVFEGSRGIDPCDADPDVPLVLLPVRLETRFSADEAQLRIRIYPDEVHLDRLDEGLIPDERTAALAYWEAIWSGGPEAEGPAWQALQHATRPARTSYVAFALTPTNLAERPADRGTAGPSPTFPDTGPPRRGGAVARALPDRFVAIAIQGDSSSRPAFGNPIPPELPVGLPREGSETDLVTTKNGVRIGAGMEWMVDYHEAENVGMALTLTLATPGAVDRLLVFGLRSSLDPDSSSEELAALLESHRFGRGLAFVPQGSPTNNTETDRTDWQRRPAPSPVPTRVPDELDWQANAAQVAAALGLDPAVLSSLDHASDSEQGQAQAASTALWSPSFGTFLSRLIVLRPHGASLDDRRRKATRDFVQYHVRGRGPLPALRIGDQPYGILPTASVDRRPDPSPSEALVAGLAPLLARIRWFWRASIDNVPRLGRGALDDTLLEILGSTPVARGLRVRSIASKTMSSTAPYIAGLQEDNTALQEQLDTILWEMLGFEPGTAALGSTLGAITKPLGLPLVHEHDPEFIDALLQHGERTVESVLQALLELAEDEESKAIHDGSPAELVTSLVEVEGAPELAGHLYPRLKAVAKEGVARLEAYQLHHLADDVQKVAGPSGPSLLLEHQPVAAVRGSLAEVALQPHLSPDLAAKISLQAVGAWLRGQARYREFTDALAVLRDTTLEERRILVAETLDLASHRLDAWITALPTLLLENLRKSRPAGTILGAYAWLEDIVPGSSTSRDGGWIHAPSVAHAATAGVLRSGYLTHNPDATGSGALAIDLSSERVRTGLELLDGIRSGQPLAALLGYRIERRLADHQLDRFILSLRALAPLLAGKLTDRSDAVPPSAQEAISANNVIDGVKLLTLKQDVIQTALRTPPANNPYLNPADWHGPSCMTEWPLIVKALEDAAQAKDAVADLLLAEGVHQLVQGNAARAGAALDAAAAGDAPPVEPDVVRTPPRGVAITHRILLLLPTGPLGGGWADAPRAAAEPRLEAWAQSLLGPATDTVLHAAGDGTRTTLEQAQLSALDVVYDSAVSGLLQARIHASIPALAGVPLADTRDPASPGLRPFADTLELAASLQRLLAGAQVALPDAFARPSDTPLSGKPIRKVADLADVHTRAGKAFKVLSDAADELAALLAADHPDEQQIAAAVRKLAGFGISAPVVTGDALLAVARALEAEASRRRDAAEAILKKPFTAPSALAAGKAVFGDAFWLLPPIEPGAPDLFGTALGALEPGAAQIRRFLRDAATVRDGVARYAETLLFGDALGVGRTLRVAQLAEPGTPGTHRWIALPFDAEEPSPDKPVTTVIVDAPAAVEGTDTIAGLVLDEWAEVAPRRVEVTGPDGQKRRQARAVTGVAVNANAPNARAPQAILLAVPADGARWSTAALWDTLEETLELAKLRAVTLERALWAGRVLPALHEQSWSLQGEKTIDVKFLTKLDRAAILTYVKD